MATEPEKVLVASSVSVDVQIAVKSSSVPDTTEIESWLCDVIARSAKSDNIEISVRIVDENESREFNSRFRAEDKATNVLSFPADTEGLPAELPVMLGDVVICGPVVEREAKEQGKDVADHWAHMLVHGALHLLGYDHESNADAEIMEALEKEILASRGIEDPYVAGR